MLQVDSITNRNLCIIFKVTKVTNISKNRGIQLSKVGRCWLGPVAHACIPSTLGDRGGQDHLSPGVQNLISTKNTKIGQAWWYVPVIPATQEAEAGE